MPELKSKDYKLTVITEFSMETDAPPDEHELVAEMLFNRLAIADEIGWYSIDQGENVVKASFAVTPQFLRDYADMAEEELKREREIRRP